MAQPDLDPDRRDDAALAILGLTLHDGNRVWNGIDRSIPERLHAEGPSHDPVGKAGPLRLTEAGLARAAAALGEMVTNRGATAPRGSEP